MTDRPTPRTDEYVKTRASLAYCVERDTADFARQLERELSREKLISESNCEFAHDLANKLKAAREENLEQARLLGMSGEREADLRGELEREKRRAEENGVLAHDRGIQLAEAREEIATLRSNEQRLIAFSKRDRKRADDMSDKLAQVVCERDRLADRIENLKSLKSLCTTDHESKEAFVCRVNAVLQPAND